VVDVLTLGAQDAQQPAHLGQRLTAGGLDGAERADRRVGIAVEDAPRSAGLHDHDRDRVGDDVVQLARDPRALAHHGVALALAALALDLARPRGELGGELRASARHAAEDPQAAEHDAGEQHPVGAHVAGGQRDREHGRRQRAQADQRPVARLVRRHREARERQRGEGSDEVLRMGEERPGDRPDDPDRRHHRQRRDPPPGQRRGERDRRDEVRRQRPCARVAEHDLDGQLGAEGGGERYVGPRRAAPAHAASASGRRARSSKPVPRRLAVCSSPP
jgi:hypothetical protein